MPFLGAFWAFEAGGQAMRWFLGSGQDWKKRNRSKDCSFLPFTFFYAYHPPFPTYLLTACVPWQHAHAAFLCVKIYLLALFTHRTCLYIGYLLSCMACHACMPAPHDLRLHLPATSPPACLLASPGLNVPQHQLVKQECIPSRPSSHPLPAFLRSCL